jgi:hypothetical protein
MGLRLHHSILQPGRSEAIRRLVEIGLHAGASAESVRAQTKASDYATEASELAEETRAEGKEVTRRHGYTTPRK